jgi:hypothetical protein
MAAKPWSYPQARASSQNTLYRGLRTTCGSRILILRQCAHANARQAFAKEDAMSSRPFARRLRASSEFTCSRCGGHEAYRGQEQNAFERILSTVMVRSVRCCDCDALCYAFPMPSQNPSHGRLERAVLVCEAKVREAQVRERTETRAREISGGTAAHIFRHRSGRATGMLPSASH